MTPRRAKRLRSLLLLIVAVIAAGLGVLAYSTDLLKGLEFDSVDARFSIRGEQPAPPDMIVVEIDDSTFQDLRLRWPFRRTVHAKVVDRLHRDRARVIAYDVQFSEASENVADDEALLRAVGRARNVVLGFTETDERGHANALGTGGDAVLASVGARAGSATLPPEAGGVLRKMAYAVGGLKSFSIVAAERANGRPIRRSTVPDGGAPIDYRGPPGTFRHVSFGSVARGKVAPGLFRDKTVIVGASSPSLQDVHATPTTGGELMSGPEVQANAIWTARKGFPLRETPGWLDVLLILVLGALPAAASRRFSALVVGMGTLVVVAGYCVAAQIGFDQGHILPFVYPIGALLLAEVGSIGVHGTTAALERERTRDLFSRFVPEQVVAQVVEQTDEDLRLGGQRLVATVMFADLRGFSTFAETVPAETVIEVLNRYLESMSDAILDHGGTLVSYMGDGIMAVFGAPIELRDHADRALAAAQEMVSRRLSEFNDWLERTYPGAPRFRMGVGLNSGPVSSGNVGSERRCEYTAVGDTTNTAARIEQMTKAGDHMLFVAESTRELLVDIPTQLVFAGEEAVRGRQGKVRLWTIQTGDGPGAEPIPAAARA
jgi:adenylate cyclase